MKKSLATIIVLLLSFSIYSQSRIIGEVVYLNSGNKAANGVEIMAKGSSGAVSKNGSYILKFPGLKAGTTVFPKIGAEIETNGKIRKIELVNSERLKSFSIPTDPTLDSLRIIVCPKGFRDEAAKKYYKILKTSSEKQIQKLKNQTAELKRKGKDTSAFYAKKILQLQEYQKITNDSLQLYKEALAYASINRPDQNERTIEYLEAIDNGMDIEEARKFLSTEKAFNEIIQYEKGIESRIAEIELEAKNLKTQFKFEQAIQKYDTISLILRRKTYNPRLLITNLHTVGLLCQKQNYFKQAERNYQEILRVYKSEGYNTKDYTYSLILNNLAVLQMNNNDFSQALKNYEEALKITQVLTKEDPRVYSSNMASTLLNLANLQKDKNEFSQALINYQEALKIYNELAKENKIIYLPDFALTLNNLAILQMHLNELPQALKNHQEALKIRRELAKENPKAYLPDVAQTLNNLAILQKGLNELPQALKNYEEALKINRELAEENPKAYLPDVAQMLNNLASLKKNKNEFPRALQNYQEALKIYRELAEENPKAYLPDVAQTLNNLAILQMDNNEFSQALKNYEESLNIYREFAEENPRTFMPNVAWTLNNLAILQKGLNELPQALKSYEESLKIYREFAKENPRTFMPKVANTLNNFAILLQDKNEFPLALKSFQEALKIRIEFAKENPKKDNIALARTYLSIAFLRKTELQLTFDANIKKEGIESVKEAKKALSIYDNNHPTKVYYNKLIISLESFFTRINENSAKLSKLRNETTILKKTLETEDNPHKKVTIQQEIIEKLITYPKEDPNNNEVIVLMSQNYGSLAWFSLFDKDFVLAEESAKKGLEVAPNQEWINTNLVLAYVLQDKYNMALPIYNNMKDKPYANGTFASTFLEDIEALEKSGITHKDFERVKKLLKD